MEPFLVSTFSVALAEIGDKTQLLALVLAARFRKPLPIVMGILLATLANHAFAAKVGSLLTTFITPSTLGWIVALSFIVMGIWILIPDKEGDTAGKYTYGAFLTTLITFFLVEIGDKTQIATVLLATKYNDVVLVVLGTTVGMMAANVPVVFAGRFASHKLPLKAIRAVAALLFIALGVLALVKGIELG